MFSPEKPHRPWSGVALYALAISIGGAALLSILDGVLRGPVAYSVHGIPSLAMVQAWVTDFRFLCEQGVYAAIILFVGAKFIETRTILTIAFDKLDASNMLSKGPDGDNVVWIGRRYGTRIEAEAAAAFLTERLKESAAS